MEEGVRGMTTALIGLLGGVLGASITGVLTYFLQRAADEGRFKHENDVRLREERREAYGAYVAACDRLHEGDDSKEARAQFRKAFAIVWLVSPSTTIRDSAHELSNFVLVRQPRLELREGEANRRKIDADYGSRMRVFLEVAQRDLGIAPTEAGSLAAEGRSVTTG